MDIHGKCCCCGDKGSCTIIDLGNGKSCAICSSCHNKPFHYFTNYIGYKLEQQRRMGLSTKEALEAAFEDRASIILATQKQIHEMKERERMILEELDDNE